MIADITPHYCESLPVPADARFVTNVLMEDYKKERLDMITKATNDFPANTKPDDMEISEYNAMMTMSTTKMCVNNESCDLTLLDFYLKKYAEENVVAEIGGTLHDHCGIPQKRLGVCNMKTLTPLKLEGGKYPRKKISVFTVKRLKNGEGVWEDEYDKVQTYKFAVRIHIVEKFLAIRNAMNAGTKNIAKDEEIWYKALSEGRAEALGNGNNRLEVSHIDHDKRSITFLRIETKNNNNRRKQDCFRRIACSASGCDWYVNANICSCTPKCTKTLWLLCEEHRNGDDSSDCIA